MAEQDIDRLLADADAADEDVEHYKLMIEARRRDAARCRATVERLLKGTSVPVRDPLARAREDSLRVAAMVAVEEMPRGFEPADLARALAITDTSRAERLLMVLAEMGKVSRYERGWMTLDPDATIVRDWVVETRVFSFADAMEGLPVSEQELSDYLDDFRKQGIIRGSGGFYQYLEPQGGTPARIDRTPPERNPPAYTEARATGKPERLQDHAKRAKQGSIPGQRHKLVMKDRRYQAQVDAQEARAEKQRRKAKGQ